MDKNKGTCYSLCKHKEYMKEVTIYHCVPLGVHIVTVCVASLCFESSKTSQVLLPLLLTDENVFAGKLIVHALCNGARDDILDLLLGNPLNRNRDHCSVYTIQFFLTT